MPIVIALALSGCASRPDCEPVSGFELGRNAAAPESACDAVRYAEAWRLGQTLGDLESELRALNEQVAPTPAERQRIRVLQREIPELETLARLEGWLPAESFNPQEP
jgi:hypothetical protein